MDFSRLTVTLSKLCHCSNCQEIKIIPRDNSAKQRSKNENSKWIENYFKIMGSQISKRKDPEDDIISNESLLAVKESVKFLKQNARAEGLFRRTGRPQLIRQILNALKKGEVMNFQNYHGDCALECAAALQLFLADLKKPVMPFNIQRLILADNPGIAAHDVARDALGLIRQDVRGRHGELLADVLELLRFLAHSAPPSECCELQGSPLPIALLPVFFRMTPNDLIKWRQVAARFSELITEAPESLSRNSRRNDDVTVRGSSVVHPERRETARNYRDFALLYPILRLAVERTACIVN